MLGMRGQDDLHRRHADAFPARRRATGGDRHRCGAGGTPSRARAAGGAAVALDLRRSAARPADAPMRDAVAMLDQRKVDFEYDGEMSPDVALEPSIRALYPFCRLTGDANVLVMPGLHSAHITVEPGAPTGRRDDDRAAADGDGAARADRADGRLGQPDRRSGLPRRVSGGEGLTRAVRPVTAA